MLLKIGELAKRTGLTVRALHHYDSIGLLVPSARSDAGYRLYNAADIARLHRIQALRGFGLSLADIGAYLTRPDLPLVAVVAQQIDMLTQQIDKANILRARLHRLHAQLGQGQEPDLADWLTTLEQMSMYDKYFTPDELKQLPIYTNGEELRQEWRALVEAVREQMDAGAGPADPKSQALARKWMHMIVRDTGANPTLLAKLNAMHEQEPSVQSETGITREMMAWVIEAANESKVAIYSKYLDHDELAFVRANISKRSGEWPPLFAKVRQAMERGAAPDSPEAQELARHWLDLFRSFAGDNPQTQAKVRKALNDEPGLRGGMVDEAMRDFIRAAMGALPRQ
jgi:MerR family transcriptional regulator, thiopeptide resistance regulator